MQDQNQIQIPNPVINFNLADKISNAIIEAQNNKKDHSGSTVIGGAIGTAGFIALCSAAEPDFIFKDKDLSPLKIGAGMVMAKYLGEKVGEKISKTINKDTCEVNSIPGQVVIIPLVADVQKYIDAQRITNYNQFFDTKYPHILFQDYLSNGDLDISLIGNVNDWESVENISRLIGIDENHPNWGNDTKTINHNNNIYMTLCYALLSAMPSQAQNPAIQNIMNNLTKITHRAVNNQNIVQKMVNSCNII